MVAVLGLYAVIRNLSADLVLLGGCALLGVVWTLEGLVLLGRDLGGGVDPDPVTLYGYLLTGVMLAVAGVWVGLWERSRFGSAAVLIVAVTMAVLQMRLPQIWAGGFA
ncbi:hypothetical protein JSY14_01240 [Brachybacterium sp. EF45031]|nr:hypothetical protein [Brachybacterium sillae]